MPRQHNRENRENRERSQKRERDCWGWTSGTLILRLVVTCGLIAAR